MHGDDFLIADKYEVKQLADKYEVKTVKVGPGQDEVKETRLLNRIVRIIGEGLELQADNF